MMRPSNDIEYVWLAREPQDFRKGINGLSIVVEEQLAHNPFSGPRLLLAPSRCR